MKILISHSSKNANYGSALVKLLTGVGIEHDRIVFTSDTSYGIPVGKNIFHWLKNLISERPFVIYLLSPEYYSSVACLNEMGAAWIVESQHATVFTPDFNLDSDGFRNGAIDPREIGFFINNEDRLTEFIESLKANFQITKNPVVVNKKVREFLAEIKTILNERVTKNQDDTVSFKAAIDNAPQSFPKATIESNARSERISEAARVASALSSEAKGSTPQNPALKKPKPTERFFQDLTAGKLKDEEIMLMYYASDTARFNLGVGWRATEELSRIKGWEQLNELGDTLSSNYDQATKRLELRNLVEVSEVTSHGNPRQLTLVKEMQEELLDLPDEFLAKCDEIKLRNAAHRQGQVDDEIPF